MASWIMKQQQQVEHNSVDLLSVRSVLRAARFAAEKHAGQRRKGAAAEPYINHLLEVAQMVADSLAEPDVNLVNAALLHDTVEDAAATREEIEEHFGPDVAELVGEVTDDKSLSKEERKNLQVKNASKKSARAARIKMADKISNLRSILSSPPENWDLQRRKEYFEWAKQVVDALPSPDPGLKAEFEAIYLSFERSV